MERRPIPVDDLERADDLRQLDLMFTTPEESLDRLTNDALLELASTVTATHGTDGDASFLRRFFAALGDQSAEKPEDDVALLCIEAT